MTPLHSLSSLAKLINHTSYAQGAEDLDNALDFVELELSLAQRRTVMLGLEDGRYEQSKPTAPLSMCWCYDVNFPHQRLHAFPLRNRKDRFVVQAVSWIVVKKWLAT